MNEDKEEILRCSFCNKSQREVKKLIAGPTVFICDECVDICIDILAEDRVEEEKAAVIDSIESLEKLRTLLDEVIVGQHAAKASLSAVLYRHSKPLKSGDRAVLKSNVLLIGPTGTGKTLLAQRLSTLLGIPFALVDATRLRRQSYFKEQNIFEELLHSAGGSREKAENGIIYLDHIDKIACRHGDNETARSVQESLLEILTGTRTSAALTKVESEIDTANVLFIGSGTFSGIEQLIENRLRIQKGEAWQRNSNNDSALSRVSPQDLVAFGLLPEFVARFSVLVVFEPLTETEMFEILTHPHGSMISQYVRLFEQEGVKLSFTDDALKAIARSAVRRQAGARSLQSVLDNLALELSLAGSARRDLQEFVVDEELIVGKGL
jgi:ATP-dependent Clp protease ATP-binding subunit ClpX